MNLSDKKYTKGILTGQEGKQVYLNPVERTLYRLFKAHPEGIKANDLLLHWKELCIIYADEALYDEPSLREARMESLCAESKTVFYANISRIKHKFISAFGYSTARKFFIRKNDKGVYRIPTSKSGKLLIQ
ncbi:MAG: hypothetical protein SPL35_01530 [Bacteroidales bacterium]|nr:hypothetical protein [Bacteroidales bacterium]